MPVSIRTGTGIASCVLPILFAVATGCGRHVDYKQALQVTDLAGGWYDYVIVAGKN